MNKYYQLFYRKDKYEINIKPLKECFKDYEKSINEDITIYNEYYMFSCDRKKLKQKALSMKQEWTEELEAKLVKVYEIKI